MSWDREAAKWKNMMVYMWLLEERWAMADKMEKNIMMGGMDEESFIQKARQYIQGQLEFNPQQWEYDGAVNFGKFSTIIDITAKLDHENPNVRIQAARVLRRYNSPTNIDYVVDCLSEHSADDGMNRVHSELQSEQDEAVYVEDEVRKTVEVLKQRRAS